MKTPDKIKKGLEMHSKDDEGCYGQQCPFFNVGLGKFCTEVMAEEALTLIRQLEQQNAEQAARLEQVTRERDALKADILRATDKAKEMQSMLDDDVHPNCDYGLYLDLCDALSDVVDWKHKELLNDGVNEDGSN